MADPRVAALAANVERVIHGKSESVRLLVTALLAQGHVLIEDIPGVGKTALARALAKSISATFRRIQFTPDLLPGDITGVGVYQPAQGTFVFQPGPLFAHVVLADEINRATPKTQSALLEAMNERSVSVDGVTHKLPEPFLVVATQNPLEYLGTYPLPESQLDRFLFTLRLGYPDRAAERRMLDGRREGDPMDTLSPVLGVEDIASISQAVGRVRMDESLETYLLDLADRSRKDGDLIAGMSPRGVLQVARAARARAYVEGRDYVVPDDIVEIVPWALPHRVIPKRRRYSADGLAVTREIVARMLADVPPPR